MGGLFFHSIYMDGSWRVKHTLSSLLLNIGEVETAGAIVLHTNRGLFPIKVEMDLETNSAYDAKVISLLVAHELSKDRSVKAGQTAPRLSNFSMVGDLARMHRF